MDEKTIVQVAAILLGFMLAFFNKWLFWDSSNNNEKNLKQLEYYVISTGLISELFLGITIIVGLFSGNITQNCLHIFMIIGVGFLLIAIFLATICEINYIEDESKHEEFKEDDEINELKSIKEILKKIETLLHKK